MGKNVAVFSFIKLSGAKLVVSEKKLLCLCVMDRTEREALWVIALIPARFFDIKYNFWITFWYINTALPSVNFIRTCFCLNWGWKINVLNFLVIWVSKCSSIRHVCPGSMCHFIETKKDRMTHRKRPSYISFVLNPHEFLFLKTINFIKSMWSGYKCVSLSLGTNRIFSYFYLFESLSAE